MALDKFSVRNGEIGFVWFNRYAGVAIKTPSKTLVIDPVGVSSKNFQKVDAILITHEHYDHLDQSVVRELFKMNNCDVIADPTSAKRLRSIVDPDYLKEVNVGLEIGIGDVKVKVEQCNHPPATTPVTFLIISEDGVKLYHTADSLPFAEMKRIGEKEKPDLVFCTVGIAPNASPKTGAEIAKLLQPKLAVPYHSASSNDFRQFAEILSKEAPKIRCMIVETGQLYKYP
jgi:L-ascorbate metabolism protein UlaG (beta-lactamase superfamily)